MFLLFGKIFPVFAAFVPRVGGVHHVAIAELELSRHQVFVSFLEVIELKEPKRLITDRDRKFFGASTVTDVEALVEDGIRVVADQAQAVVREEMLQAEALAAELEEDGVEGIRENCGVPSVEAVACRRSFLRV